LNQIEVAKENFEKCLMLNSDYTLAIIGLGNVYYEEGNYQKAEEYHRRALKIDPRDIQAIISLAYSLSGQKVKIQW
jgi:RNA polymerase-associated protein CTR9